MNYYNKYGTLNAQPCLPDSEAEENSLLFSGLHLILLKLNKLPYEKELQDYIKYVELCRVGPGLFNQTPTPGPNSIYSSHDSLTGLICVSKVFGLSYHTEIWKTIKKQWLRYDNVNPDSPSWKRIMHPRDIIFWGICADSLICKLLFPILFIIQAVASIQKYKYRNDNKIWKTDGKILTWLRCRTLKWTKSLYIYEKLNKWFSGFNNYFHVFSVYYKIDHPVRNLMKILQNRK